MTILQHFRFFWIILRQSLYIIHIRNFYQQQYNHNYFYCISFTVPLRSWLELSHLSFEYAYSTLPCFDLAHLLRKSYLYSVQSQVLFKVRNCKRIGNKISVGRIQTRAAQTPCERSFSDHRAFLFWILRLTLYCIISYRSLLV